MLPPWNKSYDQPRQHIKKQRHFIANKGPSSQSYVFSSNHGKVVTAIGCESWSIKKTEHRRTDAFELWCWSVLGLHRAIQLQLLQMKWLGHRLGLL